jgi:hypothetical protein
MSAERTLPPVPGRRAETEAWLGGLLKAWGVRSASTGRWLTAAEAAFDTSGELVIFAQYDSLMLLFTIEIWDNGQRVYGIDDWVG